MTKKIMGKGSKGVDRIKKALAQGRMVYDTGRKMGTSPVFESLSEDGRKIMGLEPLENILPNWKEYLPTKAELEWNRQRASSDKQKRQEKLHPVFKVEERRTNNAKH